MNNSAPTRWGIISCGKISHDFVGALLSSPENHAVVAASARSLSSATQFCAEFSIPKAYDSYVNLVEDPHVQVVYIGSINTLHFKLAKLALSNGKHVLCEKPMCMNYKETAELVNYAREKKLFLMEGIWSRFFPAYPRLQEELNKIGEVVQVIASVCILLSHKERCSLKEMGGGTILDIGVYCAQFASLAFRGFKPTKIVASGILNADGVDESTSGTLIYPNGGTATLVTHSKAKYESEAVIIGTNGLIRVPFRFWCPTELITSDGKVAKFDLPPTSHKFNYANSVGLLYEADEVRRCINENLTESPLLTLDETLSICEIMESIRKQTGVVYPQDS